MMTTKDGSSDQQVIRGTQSMRTWFLSAVAMLIVAAITTGLATGEGFHGRDDDRDNGPGHDGRGVYAIGLWGDLPYSTTQATVGVPNLLADMNAQDLAFTVHDSDLKAGSNSLCDDALYTGARLLRRAEGARCLHAGRQ